MDKCKCGLIKTKENTKEFVRNNKKRENIVLCKECYKEYRKEYNYKLIYLKRKSNINEYNKIQRDYYQNNKKKHNESVKKYKKKKRKTDKLFALKENIRSNVGRAFRDRNITKKSKTFDILGCSVSEFKEYIESQFESWMNWDNYGTYGVKKITLNKTWDLDHIIPISSANNESELLKLNHYSNFQPLCSYKNRFIKKNIIK